MVGEGTGSKPLSVHFSAGRIQLCILPGPVDALRACLDLLQRGCSFQPRSETSPFRDHSAPGAGRFCCRAGPPGPPACTGPLASWRGDFPQCLALSATLLLPHLIGMASTNEPNGSQML